MSNDTTTPLSGQEMRALFVSSDRNLFTEGSNVRYRFEHYSRYFNEVHIIVFTTQEHGFGDIIKIADNTWVYPTNSTSRWRYPFDAYKIFKDKLVFQDDSHCHVVSTQDPFEAGLAGYLMKRNYTIALQIQIHTDIYAAHFKSESWLNRLRSIIAWYVLDNAHCVRVVSKQMKEKIIQRYPHLEGGVQVLPIHIDTSEIENAQPSFDVHEKYPEHKFIIFMASRLTEEKDFKTAVRALAHARGQYPFMGLVIAGEGPQRKKILKEAKRNGVADAVHIVGWQDDLISYYKTANVFLVTSQYEGYGRVFVEAAAARIPIVSTSVGLAGTEFKDDEHALVCKQGDSECLGNNIARILKERGLARRLAINAAPLVQSEPFEEYLDKYCSGIVGCLE